MALERVKLQEVFPTHQERRFLVEKSDLMPPQEAVGWDDVEDKPTAFPPATHTHPETFVRFNTIAALQADRRTTWSQAWVRNWEFGDRTKSLWFKIEYEDELVPNDTDVLQTAAGFHVVKVFSRLYEAP